MKVFLQVIMIVVLTVATNLKAVQAQESDNPTKPDIIAVLMHADWCQACKVLKPKLKEVEPEFINQKILFTGFEMTNDYTKDQSRLLASQLGLSKLFEKHVGRTGYMILVDANTKEPLKTLGADLSQQQLKQQITSVLK